jgi:hypothetical protein
MEDKKVEVKKFSNRDETVKWLNQNKESGDKIRQAVGLFNAILHPTTLDAIAAMQAGGFSPEETLDALAYHYINTAANILYRALGLKEDEDIIAHRGKFAEIAIIRAATMASNLGMDWEKGAEDDDDHKE